MSFNFSESFKELSTEALLQILSKPENYQPEAITAARDILEVRGYRPGDQAVQASVNEPQGDMERDSSSVSELLEPYIQQNEHPHSEQWLQILLVVLLLRLGWTLWHLAMNIRAFGFFEDHHYMLVIFIRKYLDIIVAAIATWLLWRRNKWGWVIQLAAAIFVTFSVLYTIYTALRFNFSFDWMAQGIKIFVNVGLCLFLLHPAISGLFNITPAIKKKTVLGATAASLVVFLILRLTT